MLSAHTTLAGWIGHADGGIVTGGRTHLSGRIKLVRTTEASAPERHAAEEALRVTARQQEAVAHLGQLALAGAPLPALMDDAVALMARGLDVEYAGLLEFRPESRTLLLRAGVGWRDGSVGRTILPSDGDTYGGTCSSPRRRWWSRISPWTGVSGAPRYSRRTAS